MPEAPVAGLPRWVALGILVAVGTGIGLAATEAGLRIAGYRFRTFPTVQFGWPEPKAIAQEFLPDRELFWVTPDYYARILPGARRSRPDVVFQGDSCTQFGQYPRYTMERLAAIRPDLARGLSLGVAGWSSVQGLKQLRRDVLPLRPKAVTVYFGWNDHWVAMGRPDAEATPGALSWWLSQHVRLAQALLAARMRWPAQAGALPNRVDLPTYRHTLREMAAAARSAGVVLVFVTAPSGHVRGSEPAYLARRHLRRLAELVPLHTAYANATRESSVVTGAFLCDAAREVENLEPAARRSLFRRDGIHLSEAGDRRMAAILAGCLDQAVPRPAGR